MTWDSPPIPQASEAYIVYGQTGEFDGFNSWDVAAYLDEELADKHVTLANDWLSQHHILGSRKTDRVCSNYREFRFKDDAPTNPYDEYMHVDYTGTLYDVKVIPLNERLPYE